MSVTELLPALQDLSRAEKLRVVQFLVSELAQEEKASMKAGGNYPIWSPYESYEAAESLLIALEEERKRA